jgi:hypothetical protein
LQNYQQVEQQNRTRYRQRVERQFKIGALPIFRYGYFGLSSQTYFVPLVKPDATPEEVSAVVQGDQGAGGQVFAQAVRLTPPQTYCSLIETCFSLHLPLVTESLEPHIVKFKNDTRISEKLNAPSQNWDSCSLM